MNSTRTTERETARSRDAAKHLEHILKEALPLVDVADTDEILGRDKTIDEILKDVEAIGRTWWDRAKLRKRSRSLSAKRLDGMRRALVRVEDYLVAFDPMGSERLGRKRSAVLSLVLEAEEQRRELYSGPLKEVIGVGPEGPIHRKPGQVSPHVLERLRLERQRFLMPAETMEDLEFFSEIWRLAEWQALESSDQTGFYVELKDLWHAIRGVRRTLDDALKTRSQTLGRPKHAARAACASDILHRLHPIRLGRRREWPFVRIALASWGFSVPEDPTDFMRVVRARTRKLVQASAPRPSRKPDPEVAAKPQPHGKWSHPEVFKRRQATDKLLDTAFKL